jgi:hypothetical protein
MQLELSLKTKQRLFNRKMEREGYFAKLYVWENTRECMMTHITKENSTYGLITLRSKKYNSMGEFNSPIYNIRASRIIRDTERFMRRFTDIQDRQKAVDESRLNEMRWELKDKFKAMLNRHNFYGQIGI